MTFEAKMGSKRWYWHRHCTSLGLMFLLLIVLSKRLAVAQEIDCPLQHANISSICAVLPPHPTPSEWKHRPLLIQADPFSTHVGVHDTEMELGVPIAFESEIFKGRIIIEIVDEARRHKRHHHHRHEKWLWRWTVQGTFKRSNIPMNQLFVGEIYDQPLVNMPAPFLMKLIKKFFGILVPGIQFDVGNRGKKDKVLALVGGTVQTMRRDETGEEPSLSKMSQDKLPMIEEYSDAIFESPNAFHSSHAHDAHHRKSILRSPKRASAYSFDTSHVYTFQHYDAVLDYHSYEAHLAPGVTIDLAKHLNGQPMSMGLVTASMEWMFRFRIWHEELYEECHGTHDNF